MGVTRPGVDTHARAFVDGDDVIVFVEDIERNLLGLRDQSRSFPRLHLDDVVGMYFV